MILAGRDQAKVQETRDRIRSVNAHIETHLLVLDLQSFASVHEAAKEVNERIEYVDILINSAGIMGPPYSKTEDGVESQFQTNHLSHFLFTNLIIKKLLVAPEPRIVIVSSDGYRLGHVRYNDYNFHDGESYHPWIGYGQSKTANQLFARELAKRLGPKGLTTVSIHPGIIHSNIGVNLNDEMLESLQNFNLQIGAPQSWEEPEFVGIDQGIATFVFAAFAPDVKGFNGGYLQKLYKIPFPNEEIYPWAIGDLEQKKCWTLSEELVGQSFEY